MATNLWVQCKQCPHTCADSPLSHLARPSLYTHSPMLSTQRAQPATSMASQVHEVGNCNKRTPARRRRWSPCARTSCRPPGSPPSLPRLSAVLNYRLVAQPWPFRYHPHGRVLLNVLLLCAWRHWPPADRRGARPASHANMPSGVRTAPGHGPSAVVQMGSGTMQFQATLGENGSHTKKNMAATRCAFDGIAGRFVRLMENRVNTVETRHRTLQAEKHLIKKSARK